MFDLRQLTDDERVQPDQECGVQYGDASERGGESTPGELCAWGQAVRSGTRGGQVHAGARGCQVAPDQRGEGVRLEAPGAQRLHPDVTSP
jgi:hypothetical protein